MKSAINISNYEEFFLLYTDGELSAAEKQAVEQFVQEHPHLAEELDMLQQVKLPADESVFFDKALLYKNGEAGISAENYETYFLSYVDDELGASEKTAVETFVLQHPSLQEAFMLLKKTKLEPEAIVFPDKASLYRKEEKERRVIYMSWQRIAVAAVLVGVIALVWTLVPSGSQENNQPVIAQRSRGDKNTVKPEPTGTRSVITADAKPAHQNLATKPAYKGTRESIPVPEGPANNTIAQNTGVLVPGNNSSTVETAKDAVVRVEPSQTISAPVVTAGSNGVASIPDQAQTVTPRVKDNVAIPVADDNTAQVIVQPAVYKMLDTEDDKKSLYVGSLEINKDKLRGFFRKATSLFRGKAKQEEEERVENAPSSSNTRSLK